MGKGMFYFFMGIWTLMHSNSLHTQERDTQYQCWCRFYCSCNKVHCVDSVMGLLSWIDTPIMHACNVFTDLFMQFWSLCDRYCLTLKVLVTTIDAGCMDVGPVRYKPALLPLCPIIRILSYGNCQRSTHSISLTSPTLHPPEIILLKSGPVHQLSWLAL